MEYIGLNYNPIIKIPSGISNLKNIIQLDLNNIDANAIPDDFIDFNFSDIFLNFPTQNIKTSKLFIISKQDKDIIDTLEIMTDALLVLNVDFNITNISHNVKKIVLVNTLVKHIPKIPFGCTLITHNK